MKLAGMFLLLAGWLLVMSAIVLFPKPGPRAAFVAAGLAVEALGLILAFRGHATWKEEQK
jgi:hypothetical protein